MEQTGEGSDVLGKALPKLAMSKNTRLLWETAPTLNAIFPTITPTWLTRQLDQQVESTGSDDVYVVQTRTSPIPFSGLKALYMFLLIEILSRHLGKDVGQQPDVDNSDGTYEQGSPLQIASPQQQHPHTCSLLMSQGWRSVTA